MTKTQVFDYCNQITPIRDLNAMVWGYDQQAAFDACMVKHGYEKASDGP